MVWLHSNTSVNKIVIKNITMEEKAETSGSVTEKGRAVCDCSD